MAESWTTTADVENDMLALSDIYTKYGAARSAPPPSSHVIRARTKASIFDDEPEEEPVEYCHPVRGRPIQKHRNYRKPGGTSQFLNQMDETYSEIRQAVGLGYSDAIIEHMVKDQNDPPTNSAAKPMQPADNATKTNEQQTLPLFDLIKSKQAPDTTSKSDFPPLGRR